MKLQKGWIWVRGHKKWIVLAGGAVLLLPVPLHALFGEDIPWLSSILSEDITIATTAIDSFKEAKQMAKHLMHKETWLNAVGRTTNVTLKSQFGEMADLNQALHDTDYARSRFDEAYGKATVSTGDTSYLSEDTPGQSRRTAQLATVEMSDAAVQNCTVLIAQYNQLSEQNQQANAELSDLALSGDDDNNTNAAQLNIVAGELGQQLAEMKNSGPLHACQAQMEAVQLKDRRDQIAEQIQLEGEMARKPATGLSAQDTVDALRHGWNNQAGEGGN
jgi:hypothetical protein